jgi:hypothetical protein
LASHLAIGIIDYVLVAVVKESEAPRTKARGADVATGILPAESVHGLGVTELAINQKLSLANDLQLLVGDHVNDLLFGGNFDLNVRVQF